MTKVLIAVPAHNEEKILRDNVLAIFNFCEKNLNFDWQIVIADNSSTDQTSEIGQDLAQKYPGRVTYFFVDKKGKGLAIKSAWQNFSSDIYCFMDADLATDLSGLPNLISKIQAGNDLALGNRFDSHSRVKRSVARRIFSRLYHLFLKYYLRVKINDAPCGFKAINQKVKTELLPQVKNEDWFFDSELAILAEKKAYLVAEVPIVWYDQRARQDKSRVKIISLGFNYFKEVIKLKKRL